MKERKREREIERELERKKERERSRVSSVVMLLEVAVNPKRMEMLLIFLGLC